VGAPPGAEFVISGLTKKGQYMDAFLRLETPVQAALIATVVGFISGMIGSYFKYFLDKSALRDKIQVEYEYAERKKLRELIGLYHGRMLETAERLNNRLWNLQENESKGWLDMEGAYAQPEDNYYFTSTVYRMIAILSLLRLFEEDAIFIDARIARQGELTFLKFTKALQWAFTDGELFKGTGYDSFWQTDHIFHDKLRLLCDSCINQGKIISIEDFQERLKHPERQESIMPILSFFDGLRADEKRLRWDRIIAFHLLLMAFINSFGYDNQKSSPQQFAKIAASARNRQVIENLIQRLPRLGLAKETKEITAAV
jgi:hypothetical protein